ncbi:MAG TPA: [FeFe] hydrogenase H-cluster maturation GTPase HydF [Perlabentimonas sp.]|nr:[FeFe] hydrogenase H-cluster maturation GTPase HydF [Perlabentimonas sp.]
MTRGKENKPHIGIYGRRNNGKSSLINMLVGQDVAIVSDYAGTTTDPVKKSLEILNFGPVILIDTAGIDDEGELGKQRISKTIESIKHIDLGILLVVNNEWNTFEEQLVNKFAKNDLPYVIVHNKYDVRPISPNLQGILMALPQRPTVVEVSTKTGYGFDTLVEAIRKAIPESSWETPTLLGDIVGRGDVVMLITPIDSEAPAGRLILPQVQTIRDILDNHAISIVLKDTEVESFLSSTGIRPALVVTDSQIFDRAHSLIPSDVELTSFSILLARLKGDFENYIKGTPYISALVDNDRVLVLESCSHHVSCDDIGRVKIPNLMRKFTGKKLTFEVVPGLDKLPRSITDYALVVQCGGCVVTRKQLHNRLRHAVEAGVPVTNFGMAIAYMQGIFHRAIAPFVKEV